ncbi:unnamed protein product [Cladocopium goreaui]|uniref:Glycerophosphoryl diester phosphodiesterase YhdW n=1 Tax=Cladocopium goreaui TaxID=2562237 RepID=A0A9P1D8X4_9DINO|nr:unnamed protein product [Cladocopium goreaui]
MAAYSSEHSWLRDFVPKLNEGLRGKLVAHRGFHDPLLSDLRPLECTLPALQMAWESGVLNCECDVRLSSDEQIILLHDPNLDRLVEESARPTPNANTIMAEELLRWPLKQPEIHIPLLQDALQSALRSGNRLVIELKGSPGSPSVGAAVAQLFAKDPTLLEACALVMSFEIPELLAFAAAVVLQRPKLLLLTAVSREGLEEKYQTLDLDSPAWEEQALQYLARKDLSLDGFYIEWTERLSNADASAFEKLCGMCTVGVWQHFGQTDSEEEASRLLDLGASFCNTDWPTSFIPA